MPTNRSYSHKNMRTHSDPNPPDRPVMAYADGELDADAAIRVVEAMAQNPAVAAAVLHQQQLRQAVGRAMSDPAMKTPGDLRDRLNALAATVPAAASPRERPAVIGSLQAWAPLVAAAMLLLGVGTLALTVLNVGPFSDSPSVAANMPLISAIQIGHFENRHTLCTTSIDELMSDPDLPQSIGALSVALRERFGAAPVGLDLAPLGYAFEAVGPCNAPGSPSVHLIYRSLADSGHHGPISLWIRPSNPNLDLEPGKVQQVTSDGAKHSLVVWRAAGLDYWLIAATPDDAGNVAGWMIDLL